MPQLSEIQNSNRTTIGVGTTGTVGSLMLRELASMKPTSQNPPNSKKPQSAPVSVPCGCSTSTPKKSQERKNPLHEPTSSRNNGNIHQRNPEKAKKSRDASRRKGTWVPILGSDDVTTDQNTKGVSSAKKGHSYIVEIVDVKCNNPMSSRLKKLGFSKLSESPI